ncbi:L-histidine N(alpha)-methyltransferase [Kineobactrum salinum]|uniref:L-histidine N(Alpha)-methyltransferase n=1 Tax=Kineobactrum salinum TaxID=2708301 RepID=A0A6C0TWN4_9GAMM|nr:L-histidine N(alpha)-methyltransferase [Kineobactrum salinum]QIB64191.1 L-histidine N(alpha)-methyltransferase [Kineobactrum salinum]
MEDAMLQAWPREYHAAKDSRFHFHDQLGCSGDMAAEIIAGLTARSRYLSARFLYDQQGAALFEAITDLPEYYLPRMERSIIAGHCNEISALIGPGRVLIEPGSGNCSKVEWMLEALRPAAYVPVDVTREQLTLSAQRLVARYPWLEVHAICADFGSDIRLPGSLADRPRLLFFPGSTIGNFTPAEAIAFLARMRQLCGEHGALLIGVDLYKNEDLLNAAYNDSAGITAQFNLNVLKHVNEVAGGNFECDRFRHVAFFNDSESRVEMHLESCVDQTVTVGDHQLVFRQGDRIHTENSYKYTIAGFRAVAEAAGFVARHTWCDENGWFSVHLLEHPG